MLLAAFPKKKEERNTNGEENVCDREDNAEIIQEKVAERDQKDKGWSEVRLLLSGVGFHLT